MSKILIDEATVKLANKALIACHYYLIHAVYSDWRQELIKEAFTAHKALDEALAEQPAQVDPCPGCLKGRVCRTPKCGRLKLPADHPLRSEQPAQQEPVVWMYVNKSTHETKFQKHMRDFIDHSLWSEVPLYGEPLANHELQCICGAIWLGDEMVHLPDKRLPPQRTWVGLTDDEIAKEVEAELVHYWNGEYIDTTGARDQLTAFARAIEAAIKEQP